MYLHRRRSGSGDAWGRVFVLLIVLFVGLFFVDRFIGLDGIFQRSQNDTDAELDPTSTVALVYATKEEYVFVAPTAVPVTATPQPTPTRTPTPFIPIELVEVTDSTTTERSEPISIVSLCEEAYKSSLYITYDSVAGSYRPLTDSIPYLVQPRDAWTLALQNGIIQRKFPDDLLADFSLPQQWQIDRQYKILAISANAEAVVVHRRETEQESLYWFSRGSDSSVKLLDLPNSLEESATDPGNEWLFLRYLTAAGESELAAIDLITGSFQELTSYQKVNAYGGVLSWDGFDFAYWTQEGIWVIKLDGSFGVLLFPGAQQPSWSPSGDQMVMVKDSRLQIGTFDLMEGIQTGILQLPIRGNDPVWSPDGSKILYWNTNQGDCTLSFWDIKGGFAQEVFRTRNTVCVPEGKEQWSPDGDSVLLTLPVTANEANTSGDILCQLSTGQCQYLRYTLGDYPCRDSAWSATSFPYVWDFEEGMDGWYIIQELAPLRNQDGTIVTQSQGETPVINSPKALNVNADAYPLIEITMRVSGGTKGEINFVTAEQPALIWQRIISFDLIPDGEMHRYLLDLRQFSEWTGIVKYLRLRPTDAAAVEIEIQSIRILSMVEEID